MSQPLNLPNKYQTNKVLLWKVFGRQTLSFNWQQQRQPSKVLPLIRFLFHSIEKKSQVTQLAPSKKEAQGTFTQHSTTPAPVTDLWW